MYDHYKIHNTVGSILYLLLRFQNLISWYQLTFLIHSTIIFNNINAKVTLSVCLFVTLSRLNHWTDFDETTEPQEWTQAIFHSTTSSATRAQLRVKASNLHKEGGGGGKQFHFNYVLWVDIPTYLLAQKIYKESTHNLH